MSEPTPASSQNNPYFNNTRTEKPEDRGERKKIPFHCGDCGLDEEADYFGQNPPFCRAITFLEKSYILRDPFTLHVGNNANFLLLGSNCALCSKMTCQECSVFHSKRLCASCYTAVGNKLPQQLGKSKVKSSKD